jgi:hypothetical protein
LAKVNFLTPTAVEMFYLLTRRPMEDSSFATRLQAPFSPFSTTLWGSLIGTMLFMGFFYLLFEDKQVPLHGELKTKQRSRVQRLLQSTYTSTCEMFNCGVEVENPHDERGHTASQMLLKVGWAFFILMTTAAYTASLAAQLTLTKLNTQPINGIDDCLEQDCLVCIHGAQEDTLASSYSNKLRTEVVGFSGAEVVAKMMEPATNNSCDAFVLDTSTFDTQYEKALCDYNFVGEPVLWLAVSQPINDYNLGKGLSIIQRSLAEDRFYETVRAPFIEDQDCNMFESTVAVDEDSFQQLGIEHFIGPYFMLAIVIVMASVTKVVYKFKLHDSASRQWRNLTKQGALQKVSALAVLAGVGVEEPTKKTRSSVFDSRNKMLDGGESALPPTRGAPSFLSGGATGFAGLGVQSNTDGGGGGKMTIGDFSTLVESAVADADVKTNRFMSRPKRAIITTSDDGGVWSGKGSENAGATTAGASGVASVGGGSAPEELAGSKKATNPVHHSRPSSAGRIRGTISVAVSRGGASTIVGDGSSDEESAAPPLLPTNTVAHILDDGASPLQKGRGGIADARTAVSFLPNA